MVNGSASGTGTGTNGFDAGHRLDVPQLRFGRTLAGLAAQPPELKRGRALVERREAVGGGRQLQAVAQVNLEPRIRIFLRVCHVSVLVLRINYANWLPN